MLINQTERIYGILPNAMTITVYTDTLNTDTNKHIRNTYQYTILLYTSKGVTERYSNSHSVDIYA